MSTTEYAITAMTAAERLGNRPDECGCCDRAGLKHIVKLRHRDGGTVWMGTGCASDALYGRRECMTQVRKAFDAANHKARQQDEIREERRTRYAAALEAFHADDDNALAATGVRKTYFGLGGFDALGSFPAWLGVVAQTGEID